MSNKMDKKKIITVLQQAKPDHIQWIKQAHMIVNGAAQNQIKKPVTCAECLLGKWYDKEGYKMVNIPELQVLEKLHRETHNLYTAIFYITYDRRRKARSTIITADAEIPVDEKQFREKKLKILEKKTVKLIRLLDVISKKVARMEAQVFDSPWLT